MIKRKAKGYWTTWENFEAELRPIIDKLDHFPSTNELRELGCSSLLTAFKYHGGAERVKEGMGYKLDKKPRGYWPIWNNLEDELNAIIKDLDHFPSSGELVKLDRQDILGAVPLHGGFDDVREKMGYKRDVKPSGYWLGWENFEAELRPIIDKLGHFPSREELQELDRKDLISAFKHHGKLRDIRKMIGCEGGRKPRGYWQDWSNFVSELNPVIEKLGHFPSQKELVTLNHRDLLDAFGYYGGADCITKKMGYEGNKKPVGYWMDWGNFEFEMKPVIEELGHFPSVRELVKLKHYDILGGVHYHGNLSEIAKMMGYEENRKPVGYWMDWGNFEFEMKPVIEELGHFPSARELIDLKRQDILGGAQHHGKLDGVREKMGYKRDVKPVGYWSDWGNFEVEMNAVITELGHFPSAKELLQLGHSSLVNASKHHGKLDGIREKMGYKRDVKPVGYWMDWGNFEFEMKPVIKKLGHFPSARELIELKRQDLLGGAKHHGKLRGVRKKMGYSPIESNEEFIEFLKSDKAAANLAAASVFLSNESHDIEQILLETYKNKFETIHSLHDLIKNNEIDIRSLASEGLTNLGGYIGEYSLRDRTIAPTLLVNALNLLPNLREVSLESRFLNILKSTYGPDFNANPKGTLEKLETILEQYSDDKVKPLYHKLCRYYREILELEQELS